MKMLDKYIVFNTRNYPLLVSHCSCYLLWSWTPLIIPPTRAKTALLQACAGFSCLDLPSKHRSAKRGGLVHVGLGSSIIWLPVKHKQIINTSVVHDKSQRTERQPDAPSPSVFTAWFTGNWLLKVRHVRNTCQHIYYTGSAPEPRSRGC